MCNSSVLKPRTLSSACFVSCWSIVFGSWHSCRVQALFWFCVGVWTLTLHVQSCCGSVRSRVRSGRAVVCPRVLRFVRHAFRVRPHAFSLSCFVARSSFFGCVLSLVLPCAVLHAACVFHWLRAFLFVMFCVNTWLMSVLISCMFMSCFAHG